jgi:hypothetical protein
MKYISILICGLILSAVSWAHGDDDHGAEPHPTPATQTMASAESATQDFEVLATMEGDQLTVYVNQFASNQPVSQAQLEVESGNFKAKLKPVASGVYQASAAPLAQAGEHALAITLIAGEQADLLETKLTVASAPMQAETPLNIKTIAIWAGAASVFLLVLIVAVRRRGGKK